MFVLFLLARRYRSYAHVFVMHLMVAMVSLTTLSIVVLQLTGKNSRVLQTILVPDNYAGL